MPDELPWSATTCEVCHGTGVIEEVYNPKIHDWVSVEISECWYCEGAGWYEAAL